MDTAVAGIDIDKLVHDGGTPIELIRSTVRMARLALDSAASSVFLYDRSKSTLVLVASSGEGEDRIIGRSVPADSGIAGWVLQTGESIVVDDLISNAQFNREFAVDTGFVPTCIAAGCLESDGEPLGVIEVLDPASPSIAGLRLVELVSELARHCACALSLLTLPRVIQGAEREELRKAALANLVSQLGRSRSSGESVEALAEVLSVLLDQHHPVQDGGL